MDLFNLLNQTLPAHWHVEASRDLTVPEMWYAFSHDGDLVPTVSMTVHYTENSTEEWAVVIVWWRKGIANLPTITFRGEKGQQNHIVNSVKSLFREKLA